MVSIALTTAGICLGWIAVLGALVVYCLLLSRPSWQGLFGSRGMGTGRSEDFQRGCLFTILDSFSIKNNKFQATLFSFL